MARRRKICLLGDVGVGKTSLATRFVHGGFSPQYLTTVGVKVDTRMVQLAHAAPVKFVIWDIAGTDALSTVERSYLRGAAGYLLVADGTRPETLQVASHLKRELEAQQGVLPFVVLLNKRDLSADWRLSEPDLAPWRDAGSPTLTTSARSGENVELAFVQLAMQIELAEAGDA